MATSGVGRSRDRSVNEKFDFTICTAEYNTGLQADQMDSDFGGKIMLQKSVNNCQQFM